MRVISSFIRVPFLSHETCFSMIAFPMQMFPSAHFWVVVLPLLLHEVYIHFCLYSLLATFAHLMAWHGRNICLHFTDECLHYLKVTFLSYCASQFCKLWFSQYLRGCIGARLGTSFYTAFPSRIVPAFTVKVLYLRSKDAGVLWVLAPSFNMHGHSCFIMNIYYFALHILSGSVLNLKVPERQLKYRFFENKWYEFTFYL